MESKIIITIGQNNEPTNKGVDFATQTTNRNLIFNFVIKSVQVEGWQRRGMLNQKVGEFRRHHKNSNLYIFGFAERIHQAYFQS